MAGQSWVRTCQVRAVGLGVRQLVGSANWDEIRAMVAELAGTALTGDEKRALAVQGLRTLGVTLASWLLNLAIEAAVAWAKTLGDDSPSS